jgi:tyrosyl-tRNA synthetase
MQNFIDIITERGFTSTEKMTNEKGLRELCDIQKHGPQTAYIGFDCTAKSLHVGSLLQIMLLRWWQKCGHRPIVLLGGGTTKIGDPSGKDAARPKLDDAAIAENMESLKQVFAQFIEFGDDKALMVNNDDWLKDINYIDFLRDYGRHFSVNRMLTMDSVKLRLEREQPLSFLEFNYMILQAYDFVELAQRFNCRVQMGGSDQWGNIINGVELGRRAMIVTGIEFRDNKFITTAIQGSELLFEEVFPTLAEAERKLTELGWTYAGVNTEIGTKFNKDLFGITSPLLTTSSGAKMGKTAAGAVWLNADLLSPYDYWQFWRNTEDADVVKFLKLFTEIPLTEKARAASDVKWAYSIEQLAALEGAGINEAKKMLATEATAMLHGREAAEKAAQTAADTFSGAGVSADLPTIELNIADFPPTGWPLYDLLVRTSFATSKTEARKLILSKGVSINDVKVSDENYRIMAQGIRPDKPLKLSKGKKHHVLVKLG